MKIKALYFYKYKDIESLEKKFPKNKDLVVFFNLADNRYFIYSLCTNRKLTNPDICEVSIDTYNEAKQFFIDSENCSEDDLIEIFTQTEEEIAATIRTSILKATYENMSFGDFLGVN